MSRKKRDFSSTRHRRIERRRRDGRIALGKLCGVPRTSPGFLGAALANHVAEFFNDGQFGGRFRQLLGKHFAIPVSRISAASRRPLGNA